MHWLGTFASAPASTTDGDAYHNSGDNKSYVRSPGVWRTLAEVSVGPKGADGVVNLTVLPVTCAGGVAFNGDFSTYVKVADLGTFAKARRVK